MNYEYMLLLCQTVIILALQMPDLRLFFVAGIAYSDSYARRAADRLPVALDGLLIGFSVFFAPDTSITIATHQS
jgi:hypothetical protein